MPPFAKREIKNSFIKLLTERPISQITVKDIVEDCGVNRNSFYYHFQEYFYLYPLYPQIIYSFLYSFSFVFCVEGFELTLL